MTSSSLFQEQLRHDLHVGVPHFQQIVRRELGVEQAEVALVRRIGVARKRHRNACIACGRQQFPRVRDRVGNVSATSTFRIGEEPLVKSMTTSAEDSPKPSRRPKP